MSEQNAESVPSADDDFALIRTVLEIYEGLKQRAKRAGKRSSADQIAWAIQATEVIFRDTRILTQIDSSGAQP